MPLHPLKKAVVFFSLPLVFLSTPSFSESSVTLYGAVDSNLQWSQQKYSVDGVDIKSTRTGLNDGYLKSNIWGVKGSEHITARLDVFFNVESKLSLWDGTSKSVFSKKSVMGLSHE